MSDVIITTLLLLILSLLIISTLISSHIVVKHFAGKRSEARKQSYLNRFEKKWYDVLILNQPVYKSMLPQNDDEFKALEKLFLIYLYEYKGSETESRISQYMNQYGTKYYAKQLKNRKWSKRINSLSRIYDFRLTSCLPWIDDSKVINLEEEERVEILKVLARLAPEKIPSIFMRRTLSMAEIDFKQVLMILPVKYIDQLVDNYDFLDRNARLALIDTMEVRNLYSKESFLRELLVSNDAEIRLRSLKSLEKIRLTVPINELLRFLQSDIWEERYIGTRCLQYLPVATASHFLNERLQDEEYIVRNEAEKVLQIVGGNSSYGELKVATGD